MRLRYLKKVLLIVITALVGVIVGAIISGVLYSTTGILLFGIERARPASIANLSNARLTATAYNVLEHITNSDFQALSTFVHPDEGVVFSPHATVNLAANKRFQASEVAAFRTDSNVYVWGVYNGSAEPIEMTPIDYFSEFVFGRDYISATVLGVNYIVRSGNALENIVEEFPNVQFVDFHLPGNGRDPTNEANWSSIRLGFEEYDDVLWLTVVLRSQWTS